MKRKYRRYTKDFMMFMESHTNWDNSRMYNELPEWFPTVRAVISWKTRYHKENKMNYRYLSSIRKRSFRCSPNKNKRLEAIVSEIYKDVSLPPLSKVFRVVDLDEEDKNELERTLIKN